MGESNFSWSEGTMFGAVTDMDAVVFGGAFWSDASLESPVSDLLARSQQEKITLEQMLDEPTILQEVQAPNRDLLSFLAEHLDEMLDYITLGKSGVDVLEEKRLQELHNAQGTGEEYIPPPPAHAQSNEHYAYVSCEILTVNTNVLTNAILNSESHLDRLFQILDLPPPLPARSTGYFHMILLLLAQRDASALLRYAARDRLVLNPSAAVMEAPKSTSASASVEKGASAGGAKRRFEEREEEEASTKKNESPPESIPPPPPPSRTSQSLLTTAGMGLVPAFLRHVDSHSIACAFMVLLQAAADQIEMTQDLILTHNPHFANALSQHDSLDEDDPELVASRKLFTGGSGTASAILTCLVERTDSYSHSNVADLLIELFRRAASARKVKIESMQLASMHAIDEESQGAPFAVGHEDEDGDSEAQSTPGGLSSHNQNDDWTTQIIDQVCAIIVREHLMQEKTKSVIKSAKEAACKVLSLGVVAFTQPFSGQDSFISPQDSCLEIEAILKR